MESYIWRETSWGRTNLRKAATGITEQLVGSWGWKSDRLKTGTPPIDGRSLDYSKMEEQKGDEEIVENFLIWMWMGHSATSTTTAISLHQPGGSLFWKRVSTRSLYVPGTVQGVGPKLSKFRRQNQSVCRKIVISSLFEPEDGTRGVYVNRFSTSLPAEQVPIRGASYCFWFWKLPNVPSRICYWIRFSSYAPLFFGNQTDRNLSLPGKSMPEQPVWRSCLSGIDGGHQCTFKKQGTGSLSF